MDQPKPLNLIQLGNEWIVTNGERAADGSIYFPEADPAEEVPSANGAPPVGILPGNPTAPPASS